MIEDIFNIESFNIVSDDEYYYFFRALNNRDHKDIESGITTDSTGLHTIKTDREHYEGEAKYSEYDEMTLEEVYDHIKIHHRIDTNCISLTSNANVAIMYGREYYNDEYAIIKVPKNELGSKTVLAGLYMLKEIEKTLNEYINSTEIDDMTKYYLDVIDNVRTEEQLNGIISRFKEEEYDDSYFQKGIEYIKQNYNPTNYGALSPRQNLEKNKLVAKLNILNKQILPNTSNKLLIQTIGIAFGSLELVHHNEIKKEEITECPRQIMDCFALLQQIDSPYVEELKLFLINYLNNPLIYKFKYQDFDITDTITLDMLYNITDGSIDYSTIYNIYTKTYYLSKSKLKCLTVVAFLNKITNNNTKYQSLFNEMIDKCFGVEPKIFIKTNEKKYELCESIGLDISYEEKEILDLINNLNKADLEFILKKPESAIEIILEDLDVFRKKISKDEWFANAIIDSFDFKKLNIKNISIMQRQDLVNKLKESNCVDVYYKLKSMNISEKDISNVLLTSIIKNKKLDLGNIKINETFTIYELENFLGYYKINTTEINLREYQATTVKKIDKAYEKHKFCGAILPTGAGKSFVALTEMLKFKNREILYLAPNDTILNQIEDYIVEYIRGKHGTFGNYNSPIQRAKIIKEIFPNLKLVTYQKLNRSSELRKKKYDFIIFDEVHRSGAPDWIKSVKQLVDNQSSYVKILGITATPERDCDGIDMVDYWANYLGYTKTEINKHKHLAINMDIFEAIKLGYVVNPKVVSCVYDLLKPNGELDTLSHQLKYIKNSGKMESLLEKYQDLRKQISEAKGVKDILIEHLRKGRKYIVFCPVVNENGRVVEDTDGNIIDSKITGVKVIEKYINLLGEYLGKENIECYSMLGEYSKSKNRRQLELFEKGNEDKITFLVVMDKANEGMHIKNNGLIWFRALGEESAILCSQQFGRIIYSLTPGEEILDDDLPIAIDLTNNLIRIKMSKNRSGTKVDDLDRLKYIVEWIWTHNQIPDINSKNTIESRYASILKSIQKKYAKYQNPELFSKLKEEEQDLIDEIFKLGNSIDLWNLDIPKKIKDKSSKKESRDIFELSGLLRDFYDLKTEVENNLPKLSFEQKIEEIYIEYLKTGTIIKTNSEICFSSGSRMASWLYQQKNNPQLFKYAEENECARKIVELAHLDKTSLQYKLEVILSRVKHIYEKYVLPKEKIPNEYADIAFEDGVRIGGWLKRDKTKEYIYMLLDKKDENHDMIQSTLEYLGWNNIETKEDVLKRKIKYVYENYYIKGLSIPSKNSQETFEDGVKIHGYLKRNKANIIRLANEGNEYAILLLEKTEFFYSKEQIKESNISKRLDYIYNEYILKKKEVPNRNSLDKFEDGVLIGSWIKAFKEKIKEYAENGDVRAIEIFKTLTSKLTKKLGEKAFLDEMAYIYEEANVKGRDFNKERTTAKFPSGKIIINWYYNRYFDILKYANEGNIHAKFVIEKFKKKKFDESTIDKIRYLYEEYILKGKKIPRYKSDATFLDGGSIVSWIHRKNIKLKIIELANENNYMAIEVAKDLNIELNSIGINSDFLKKLDYLIEKYINNGSKIPNTTSIEKFEDGKLIGEWLNYNKVAIKKLAEEGNENAKKIVEQFGWDIDSFDKTIKLARERIHYIYEEYIKKGKELPRPKSKDVFPDKQVSISNWLRLPRVKEAIKVLIQEKNNEAIELYELIKWDIFYTKEQQNIVRIEYIYNTYIKNNLDIPSSNSNDVFEDSIKIGSWIKDNKDMILEIAKKGNEPAKRIVEVLMLDKTVEEKYKEKSLNLLKERLEFIYEKYISKGLPLPKYDSKETFDDGTPIYKWINRKANKENMELLAERGDTLVLEIMKNITWGKKELIRLAKINTLALEICLSEKWILEKDANEYPTYLKIIEEGKIKK